jgi:FkbM family methyltransferase
VAHPLEILDLGGNIGLFVAYCKDRWPTAHITTVEPDPDNLELLERTAAENGGISVIAGCATARDGHERFMPGLLAESYVARGATDAGGTIQVPSVDALRLAQSADLVKLDIEGSEWEILADPRLHSLSAPALVMEWHDKQCPHPDPRQAAQSALRNAGFEVVAERIPTPNSGTIWALRR